MQAVIFLMLKYVKIIVFLVLLLMLRKLGTKSRIICILLTNFKANYMLCIVSQI